MGKYTYDPDLGFIDLETGENFAAASSVDARSITPAPVVNAPLTTSQRHRAGKWNLARTATDYLWILQQVFGSPAKIRHRDGEWQAGFESVYGWHIRGRHHHLRRAALEAMLNRFPSDPRPGMSVATSNRDLWMETCDYLEL